MSNLSDAEAKALLDAPNHAVLTTVNPDGSLHSTVIWQEPLGDTVSINSAVGRRWPTNLDKDPRATLLVMAQDNPYEYVEIRGTATGSTDGAEEQADRLAKKYMGLDVYPFRTPTERRISYGLRPERVRYVKQG